MLTAIVASKLNLQKKIEWEKSNKLELTNARKQAIKYIEKLIKNSMYNEDNSIDVDLYSYIIPGDQEDFVYLYMANQASRDYIHKTLIKRGFIVEFDVPRITITYKRKWLFFKEEVTENEGGWKLRISWPERCNHD